MYGLCLCAVYAFRFYTWSSWAVYSNNISIWVSPTEVWTNGSLCVSNFSPSSTAVNLVHSFIPCAKPISNTLYVTVTKPLADGAKGVNQYLHIWELQVLRAGRMRIPHTHCTAWAAYCGIFVLGLAHACISKHANHACVTAIVHQLPRHDGRSFGRRRLSCPQR